MLKIGLTGGIGSGKTTVTHYFSHLGVPIIDADIIARDVVKVGMPGHAAIVENFGKDILRADNELDREKLRERVFSDKQEKIKLERILHPLIRQQIKNQISLLDNAQSENGLSTPYCLIVIPLMIETGQVDLVDYLTVVDVPVSLQVERAMQRDGSSIEIIKSIIQSQVDADTRRNLADYIIENSFSREELKLRVQQLHGVFLDLAKH